MPRPLKDELEASWQRLFSDALPQRPLEGLSDILSGGWCAREAVTEKVLREDIRAETEFTGTWRFRAELEKLRAGAGSA